ncbi:unnamed protein product [Protopolystoma xenopodis]|uniref:Neurotransmitter-gated ion-channel transmembrane domain-containing protein n=1 Tax=Protopolystoma xenopodis TaxID=117903 RepID=A0A448XME7_9PLAT|nr:unnamed protein product [Protopolystoma xenopodis]
MGYSVRIRVSLGMADKTGRCLGSTADGDLSRKPKSNDADFQTKEKTAHLYFHPLITTCNRGPNSRAILSSSACLSATSSKRRAQMRSTKKNHTATTFTHLFGLSCCYSDRNSSCSYRPYREGRAEEPRKLHCERVFRRKGRVAHFHQTGESEVSDRRKPAEARSTGAPASSIGREANRAERRDEESKADEPMEGCCDTDPMKKLDRVQACQEWRDFARLLDRVLFIAFLVVMFTTTLVLLIFIPLSGIGDDQLCDQLITDFESTVVVTGQEMNDRMPDTF